MPQITSYFASLGFEVNKNQLKKVDSALKGLEKKLSNFGKNISRNLKLNLSAFSVDQKKLNFAMGTALDIASKQTVFQVSRFNVDQAHLNRTLSAAMVAASAAVSKMTIRPNITPNHPRGPGSSVTPRGGSGRHVIAGGVAGGIAGGLSRLYGPALALGLGGYGLGALNTRNQQVVSAQLQTQAVAQQAGATPEQGKASFEWLRKQADKTGFNYLDAAPDYNKLTSGLTSAGMSIEQSQGVFKGFSELSRVNKLDRTAQSRVYRALSQIAGKNKLQSEELTGQLAESLPGAVGLFAEAYQKQTGGKKTGQEAIAELLAAMKKGKVKGDILTFAGDLASKKAAPGLGAASTASQAEQARYQNQVNDLAVVASNSGVESGFARLFRALNDGLKESGPLVEGLAQGFDNVSKYVSFAALSMQSIQRFFDGRDSYLGSKFFPTPEDRSQAFEFLNAYKGAMKEIGDLGKNIYSGWADLIKLFDSDAFKNLRVWADTVANTIGTINRFANRDFSGAGDAAKAAGFGYLNYITTPAQKALDFVGLPGSSIIQKLRPEFDPAAFETQQRARQDEALANRRKDNFNGPLGIFPMEKAGMPDSGSSSTPSPLAPKADVTLKMDVKITAANPEDFKTQFESSLADIVHQTLDKYSEKE